MCVVHKVEECDVAFVRTTVEGMIQRSALPSATTGEDEGERMTATAQLVNASTSETRFSAAFLCGDRDNIG